MSSQRQLPRRVIIGCDHTGLAHKEAIIDHLLSLGIDTVEDVGAFNAEPVDYPDIATSLCAKMIRFPKEYTETIGILICGTGIGISIAANKCFPSAEEAGKIELPPAQAFRAALCYTKECVEMTRLHNNANILCMGARQTAIKDMITMVDTFLQTSFEGGRHAKRIAKFGKKMNESVDN